MAKKTEIANVVSDAPADIAALLDDTFGAEGAEAMVDVDPEDIEVPSLTWNKKGTDKEGNPYAANLYFHTADETVRRTVNAVFLYHQKQYRWAEWDAAEDRSQTKCVSFDRMHGTLRSDQPGVGKEGFVRPCATCPQKRWGTRPDGTRVQLCFDVYAVFALDLETRLPFTIRYKKQFARVFKQHLARHHLNKMMRGGQPQHIPLFMFAVTLGLQMDAGGKYAHPTIERGEVMTGELLRELNEAARGAREHASKAFQQVETEDETPAQRAPLPGQQTEFTAEDY